MIAHKTIVDKDGFIISVCEQFENNEVKTLTLGKDCFAVEYFNKKQIVNGREVLLLKPQWNGTEWIETATQEELNIAYPTIETQQPTETELLKAQLLETQALVANLQEQILLNNGGM